jgi:C1A family cysteine protease
MADSSHDTPYVGFNERDDVAFVDAKTGKTEAETASCTTEPIARRVIKRYGWRPDTPDIRDRPLQLVRRPRVTALPARVDHTRSPFMPPIYDQGQLGSCTGNAIARAFQYELRRQRLPDFIPSRLGIYFGEREIEHTVEQDAGAEIRDGIKVLAKTGVGPEQLWPYSDHDTGSASDPFRQRPSQAYFDAAAKHRCIQYERVPQTERDIKAALAEGFLVVFGISVYESFESDKVAQTGRVPMPKTSERMLGGHAIAACGYAKTTITDANSWGTSWGRNGFFSLPLDYVLDDNLSSD